MASSLYFYSAVLLACLAQVEVRGHPGEDKVRQGFRDVAFEDDTGKDYRYSGEEVGPSNKRRKHSSGRRSVESDTDFPDGDFEEEEHGSENDFPYSEGQPETTLHRPPTGEEPHATTPSITAQTQSNFTFISISNPY